ncbi:MAG: antibiotic biosynthesis monooxygenase [Actinobacteria bacterium]|nr:antibiotic biosynthesis monooxygenase [Actinomycetota bacterium]NBY82271.1 antibiotic biosynthesis monooxygenase [Actinomycetota bacterium]NCA25953.1 antibiotic biosynthesis monooxygenase [Actinomycetota bacterium]NCU77914.1 antibiotic biosynthesis monooxygenase [Actinomycetota bacterium]
MSTPLYLIATIYPATEHLDFLKKEFAHLVSEAYKESGCEMYDLVAQEDSDTWVMMEKWSSKAQWDDHMQTAHVKHINSIDKKYFRKPTELTFLNPVQI